MFEPRYLTGPALIVVGLFFGWIFYRLWVVHPINRVFRLGPYVTEQGLEAVLKMRSMFLALSLLNLESGIYRTFYWYFEQNPLADTIRIMGAMETVFAVWFSVLCIRAGVKLWLTR